MKAHRHENEVDALRWQRDSLSAAVLVLNPPIALLFASQLQHLERRVEADHVSVESGSQSFGEAPGPAPQVENARDRVSFQLSRDRVHPEVEYLRAMIARAIVASGDIGLVVVCHSICGQAGAVGLTRGLHGFLLAFCIRARRNSSVQPSTTIGHSDTAMGRGKMKDCPSAETS